MSLKFRTLEKILLAKQEIEIGLKEFISFERLYLYDSSSEEEPYIPDSIYIKEEKKALFPLSLPAGGRTIIYLEGIEEREMKKISPLLPSIIDLILEKVHLEKERLQDRLSGTYNLYSFLENLTFHIEKFLSLIEDRPSPFIPTEGNGEGGEFCVAAIRIRDLGKRIFSLGFGKLEKILQELSQAISLYLDGTKEIGFRPLDTFYIFLKGNGRKWEKKLSGLRTYLKKKISWEEYLVPGPHITLTYLSYPSDLDGWVLKRPSKEVSSSILAMCDQGLRLMSSTIPEIEFFAVPDTIKWGGKIEKIMEDKRIVINLGREMGIKIGNYFGVIERGKQVPMDRADLSLLLKAEIVITHCQEGSSIGETLFLKDPRSPIREGDKVILLKDEEVSLHELILPPNPRCCLKMHQFINAFYSMCPQYNTFSLLLLKGHPLEIEKIKKFLEDLSKEATLVGKYGTEGYILFFPDTRIDTHHPIYSILKHALLGESKIVAGIANYPCLTFNKYEILANVRSALEHASLLRAPRVAIFDSITLTLRGDREFIKSDILAAASEYRAALALDSENHIARNSLGICYAHLGYLEKAAAEFKKLTVEQESLPYLYNLASVYIKLKSYSQAVELLFKCLSLDPEHLYTLLKLGKVMELKGEWQEAKKWYKKISPKAYPPVLRYIAQIYLREGNILRAQDCLEDAISLNPMDAEAIFLLGKIYMEHKGDKNTALALIRKSTELRPDKIAYRQLLLSLSSE